MHVDNMIGMTGLLATPGAFAPDRGGAMGDGCSRRVAALGSGKWRTHHCASTANRRVRASRCSKTSRPQPCSGEALEAGYNPACDDAGDARKSTSHRRKAEIRAQADRRQRRLPNRVTGRAPRSSVMRRPLRPLTRSCPVRMLPGTLGRNATMALWHVGLASGHGMAGDVPAGSHHEHLLVSKAGISPSACQP